MLGRHLSFTFCVASLLVVSRVALSQDVLTAPDASGHIPPIAQAVEVKLATTQPNDVFVRALQSSKYLAQSNIKLKLAPVEKDDDVLDSVIKGTADLGLFAVGILSNRKFEEQPQLYSLFTRSFVFTSGSELLDVERTPVGAAVLADVSRVGLFPLSFWNRGLSTIWAKSPVSTPEDFHGLTIAQDSMHRPSVRGADPHYEESNVLLTSLGAKPTLVAPNRIAGHMARGDAVLRDPIDTSPSDASIPFTIYATGFQPQVGIFASSLQYWASLSEHDKAAWKQSIDAASAASETQINTPYKSASHIIPVTGTQQSLRRLASTAATAVYNPAPQSLEEDLWLLDQAKAYLVVTPDSGKKNKNFSQPQPR
jgi:hypothetical protein